MKSEKVTETAATLIGAAVLMYVLTVQAHKFGNNSATAPDLPSVAQLNKIWLARPDRKGPSFAMYPPSDYTAFSEPSTNLTLREYAPVPALLKH